MKKGVESLRTIYSKWRLANASTNQRNMSEIREGHKRIYGTNMKSFRAEEKRRRGNEYVNALPRLQFDRAVRHITERIATVEDRAYVARFIDVFQAGGSDHGEYAVLFLEVPTMEFTHQIPYEQRRKVSLDQSLKNMGIKESVSPSEVTDEDKRLMKTSNIYQKDK